VIPMDPWSCDAARMARWRAIDRERARRNDVSRETATEPTEAPPVAAPPEEPRPRGRCWGAAAYDRQPAVHRVFAGPRGRD